MMEKLRQFAEDKRGIVAITQVIILLAGLMIGAIVFSQLKQQALTVAQNNNDTDAQSFITDTGTTGWSALNLFVIAAIVLAAGFILSLLVAWGRTGGGAV